MPYRSHFPAKNDWGILLGRRQEKQNENIMIVASPFLLFRPEALHGAMTGTLRRKGSLWPIIGPEENNHMGDFLPP
jgi:hypothetical protein